MPGVFPDYMAPVVRNNGIRELAMLRWGMPGPPQFGGAPITNIRNVKSARLRGWLKPEDRCVVPFTSFSEFNKTAGGNIWFAFDHSRPLAFFAGIWTNWTCVRKVKEGETTNDLFGFLTTESNNVVGAIHPKAMPVILRKPEEIKTWMTAPADDALKLQRPLDGDVLEIVARGERKDERA